jgi:hypothetical protein
MFDFPIKTDSLTDIPTAYQSLYTQAEEGGATLDPALAAKLDTSGLTSALEKERGNSQVTSRELKDWRALGETPETVLASLQNLERTAEEAVAVIDDLTSRNHQYLVTTKATEALLAVGGCVELLMPHMEKSVRVETTDGAPELRIIGPDGQDRRQGEEGFMTVHDLVEEMRASSVFARGFDPVGNRGSGMDPTGPPPTPDGRAGTSGFRLEDIATGKVVVAV